MTWADDEGFYEPSENVLREREEQYQMSLMIENAQNIARDEDWRVLLYSKPGTGKTSAIKYLTGKTLVLALDHSTKVLAGLDVDVVTFDRNNPDQAIGNFITDFKAVANNYDNLVIDNISSFEKDWFIERGRKSKNGVGNEIQDYGQWTNYFLRIVTALYSIKGINIYVTAWESQNDITTETGQVVSQYGPLIRESVRDTLLGLTDVVGRVVINPKTSGRGVILEGNDGIFAKNRLDNRKISPIEALFNFKVGDVDVQAPQVPEQSSESSEDGIK